MRIAYLSDCHTEHGVRESIRLDEPVDVLILAGDVGKGVQAIDWAATTFGTMARHIIFVAGNHDYYRGVYQEVLRTMRDWAVQYPNLHFLENDTVEIDGWFFVGATCWTDFSYASNPYVAEARSSEWVDYRFIMWQDEGEFEARHMTPADTKALCQESKSYIFGEIARLGAERTIVVTHMAPTHMSVHGRYETHPDNDKFVNNWANEVAYNGPKLWFHGHVHDPFDYVVGETRVLCNPAGYHFEAHRLGEPKMAFIEV